MERNFHLFITIYWLYRIARLYKKAKTAKLEKKEHKIAIRKIRQPILSAASNKYKNLRTDT